MATLLGTLDSLNGARGPKPSGEHGQADAALPNIRRSRRQVHQAGRRRLFSVRARSTHSDHDRFLPSQTCQRIQRGRHPVPNRPESFLPPQRGYLGASIPPSRFMFLNRNCCFSEEAALTGKYRPSKAIASSAVEIPPTFIRFKIWSRSVSPRTGSVTLTAFSFKASKYSADGTET